MTTVLPRVPGPIATVIALLGAFVANLVFLIYPLNRLSVARSHWQGEPCGNNCRGVPCVKGIGAAAAAAFSTQVCL